MKNKSGFTLIEVLVAVVISVILALGVSSLVSNMTQMSMNTTMRADLDDLARIIQLNILNQTVCRTAFVDAANAVVPFSPALGATAAAPSAYKSQVDHVFLPPATNIATVNQRYGRVTVTDLYLSLADPTNSTPGTATIGGVVERTFVANLNILGRNDVAGNIQFAPRTVPVMVVVDAAGAIVDCYGVASSDAICTSIGATYNPATGKCDLNVVCPPVPAPVPPTCAPAGLDYVTYCTPPVYFLVFHDVGAPTCECSMSCSGPAGAAGAPGAPGTPGAPGPPGPPGY